MRFAKSEEYKEAMREMLTNPKVLKMGTMKHHECETTLSHSVHVTETAYRLSQLLHMKNVRVRDLVRGGMLHDFYLYDYDEEGMTPIRHAKGHPKVALKNALENFNLSEIEKNIILSHMWPLNITRIPKYRESALICVADKYCAAVEYGRAIPQIVRPVQG